jgi:pimeloyl-ACP methyl ester carboxylesterase
MSETAVVFGEHENLYGILRDAEDQSGTRIRDSVESGQSGRLAVVMMTAGMTPSAGPFRLHVELARELADHGIPSLRFDLSGIGESFGVGAACRSIDRAALEASAALDFLQQELGCEQFVMFGLCSGADDSFHAALSDPRIIGVILMDGCGYRTSKYYLHRMLELASKATSPTKWMHKLSQLAGDAPSQPSTLQTGDDVREFPPREVAEAQLNELIDRGTQVHFLYTGGVAHYYNHANQIKAMFPSAKDRDEVSSRYLPELDHVAMLVQDRNMLIDHVATVTKQQFHRLTGPSPNGPSGLSATA